MAIKLKSEATYEPPIRAQYGVSLAENAWYGVIDGIDYNKAENNCFFGLDIYASKEAREAMAAPVDRHNFHYHSEKFGEEIGCNGLTIPQAYAKALETLTDWESDE